MYETSYINKIICVLIIVLDDFSRGNLLGENIVQYLINVVASNIEETDKLMDKFSKLSRTLKVYAVWNEHFTRKKKMLDFQLSYKSNKLSATYTV